MDADFEINHQATDLYLKLFASGNSPASLNSRTEKKWTAGVEYKNSRREVKQYVSNLEISRDMDSIMLQLITPEDNWAIRYTILSGQTYQIMVLRNAKPTYDVVVTYNPQERIVRFEIKKSSTSEVLFHASAQLTNSDTARVRIWHTEQGIRIDDGEFIVRLSRADLLNTKFYVRPGFTREIQHVSRQKMNQWKKTGGRSNALKKIGNAAVTAVSSTGVGLRNDIQTHTQPLFQYWNQETGQMVSDIGPGMEEVSDQILLYWEMSKELGLSFLDVAETSLDQVMDTVPGDNLKEYYNSMKETISSMPETLREMIEPLLEAWARLIQVYEEFSSKMSDGKQWISDKLNIEEARDKLCRAWEDVKNSDLVRQTNQWYEDTLRSVTGMSPRQVYRRYYKKVEDGVGRMSALGGQLWDEWEDWILEFEVGRDMADWVQEIGSKLKSNYISYVDPEDRFENIISWLRELISSYNPGTDAGWNRYLPNVKVNDPETGQYEVDIPLPMKVHSLEHLASHAHPKTLQAVANKIQSKFNPLFSKSQPETEQQTQTGSSEYSGGYSVWDTVYHYKPTSWKPHNWVPPYESTAYIIGNQHFVTFDGRVYDFMGNCEYLLARDFQDKKFTITVEFTLARGGRSAELKNLKVHSSGHLIELPRVGPVKVDGQEVELPWQKMDRMEGMVFVKVMEKKTAVVLKTSDNLKVKCRRNFFMCSITLPGHYHAKSAGLLGSNDNEPNNDMTTSDGTITNAVEDFAKSWHTGGRKCSSERNLAPSIRVQPGSTLYNVCKRKFLDNNSPFRACFGQINPSPYMSMCRVDMQTYGSTASCNISAAYIAACNRQGIELTMPVNCGEPASTFQDRQIAKSADVVFAVEERPSMKWTQGKIPDIARRLKGELRKKGLATIRYGVIGFSGEGVHYKPHFHTGGGQINMNLNGLQVAARNLAMDKTTMESFGSPVDPMKTLDFIADKYPFRPTVNKIVVLITSTECGSKSVGYYDLQTKVLELGIMLHMITEKEIELDSGSGSFIGLDAHSLFTSTGSNSELRENLVEPHDSCTILAQETNGTVFSGKNDNAQKHGAIVQRITSEIGNKLIPTTCQMCECQLSRCQTSPFKVCFPCEIPRPVSLTNSDKFFNIPYLKLKKTAQEALAQWVA